MSPPEGEPALVLDAGHEGCGALLVLVAGAMRRLAPGACIEVLAYDLGAREDIPAWCRMTGHTLCSAEAAEPGGAAYRYTIRKKEATHGEAPGEHHAREGQPG